MQQVTGYKPHLFRYSIVVILVSSLNVTASIAGGISENIDSTLSLTSPNKAVSLNVSDEASPEIDRTNPDGAKHITGEFLATKKVEHNDAVVWAINIAGGEYQGKDGILYQEDNLALAGSSGTISNVDGSQDSEIFKSFQQGNFNVTKTLPNGIYDITFKFAEPNDIGVGSRVFDVVAENKVIIENLDIRLARDGKSRAALVRTATGIRIEDGELTISFNALQGAPVLSAIVVRKQFQDPRNWQLVWQDEFNRNGRPDASKWNFDQWPAKKVNGEDQAYTNRAKNARVEDGLLVIEAHKEDYGNAKYTSARLNAQGKGDFLYGRAEVRAKIPAGQGTWSAIWMLPSNPYQYATTCKKNEDWQGSETCDAWPNSGEIDIMEHVGYDMHTIHGTVHNKAYYWINWQQRKASIEGQNVDKAFHTYAVEWSPENITVYLDNVPYFFYRNEGKDWRSWPFDHPYHLILNLAIGGAWGRAGGPIDDDIFPVQMLVDYVRIYKLKP